MSSESKRKQGSAYVDKTRKRGRKRNLEPHVILHLRITEDDIQAYMEQRIQMDPLSISQLSGTPTAYEPVGSSLAGDQGGMYATWDNAEAQILPRFPQKLPGSNTFAGQVGSEIQSVSSTPRDIGLYNLNVPSVSLDENPDIPTADPSEDENSSDVKFRLLDAMCEFADANRRKEWPRSTSVWCRWCCAPFSGPPVSVPRWKIKDTFFVLGCYCSYSCAAAHLFFRGDITDDDKWESYNLLHLLRKKILNINSTKKIPLADPQELLQKFGGHLSVEEFRERYKETHTHHKVYKVLYPPMISIVPKIEEQSFTADSEDMRLLQTPGGVRAFGKMKYVAPKNENYHSRKRYGKDQPYIPVDQERMVKARENLKIRRNKPLLDKKHTLFNYMNLQIKKKKGKAK